MQIKRTSSALLCAAAAATSLMASTAKAIFVLDVRAMSATGGATLVNMKTVKYAPFMAGTITFELWGTITAPYGSGASEDGNPNNEANKFMIGSFLTTGGGIKGNLAATVVPGMQGPGFSAGTVQDLDGDGDLDIGSSVSTSASDYWAARATDTINGLPGQAALLGTMTFTYTAAGVSVTDLLPTRLNFRKKMGTPSSVGSWDENGVTVLSNSTNVAAGASVELRPAFDPEPASTGLITIVGLTTLARRKPRRA